MTVFKKTVISFVALQSLAISMETNQETLQAVTAPTYFEQMSSMVTSLPAKTHSSLKELGRAIYKNRVPLASATITLSTLYALPLVASLSREEVEGYCPSSIKLADLLNRHTQPLLGDDGSPMGLQDGWVVTREDGVIYQTHYSQNELPDFLIENKDTWTDDFVLLGGRIADNDYTNSNKVIYDCAYFLIKPTADNLVDYIVNIGFHLYAPSPYKDIL